MTDIEKLEKMDHGETQYFNWFEGGGAEVLKYNGLYFLFEVPQYGGDPRYYDAYSNPKDVIDVYSKWT